LLQSAESAHISLEMAQLVEDWYKQMPIITRSYLTLSVLTTVGCALEVISPLHVYLNSTLVVEHYEVWRLVSNFFYFGKLDLDFLFHMFFLARYCKLLEETSFRGRTADFFFMLLFGGSLLTTLVVAGGQLKFGAPFADIIFLSNSLTFMMVCNLNFPCLFLQFSVSVIPERLFYLLVQDLRYCNSILIII
jgi:Derlin-2/3